MRERSTTIESIVMEKDHNEEVSRVPKGKWEAYNIWEQNIIWRYSLNYMETYRNDNVFENIVDLSYSRVHGDTRLNAAKMAEIADRKSM